MLECKKFIGKKQKKEKRTYGSQQGKTSSPDADPRIPVKRKSRRGVNSFRLQCISYKIIVNPTGKIQNKDGTAEEFCHRQKWPGPSKPVVLGHWERAAQEGPETANNQKLSANCTPGS